ncbi:hypothetical protein J5N97_011298 [Dioscorea zingiberensis]|uniref:Uncharacterized protein n=1 Tax=Dioscorea zingiberensis TaxID=325984 RepID=A0A9D5HNH2_9LILI|nr:hypothetical protein J5N97_011298 [Dioscorea zingiberensis]
MVVMWYFAMKFFAPKKPSEPFVPIFNLFQTGEPLIYMHTLYEYSRQMYRLQKNVQWNSMHHDRFTRYHESLLCISSFNDYTKGRGTTFLVLGHGMQTNHSWHNLGLP